MVGGLPATKPPADRPKTLILGVGNTILSDEGAGVRAIERLQERYTIPGWAQVMDGGTLGLDLLYYLEGVERLVIVDAVETGEAPGTIIRLENDEVPAFLALRMSPHQLGIPDMLFAAKLRDLYPASVVLWGIQPGSLEVGLELSPPVAARLDALVDGVARDLGLGVLWNDSAV